MTLLGQKLWLSLQEGDKLICQGTKCLSQVQQVVSSSHTYAEEGQMAFHPQKVEWERPVKPQMWNPAQVKLLALDCKLMETRHGLLLSWPQLKCREIAWLVFHRVRVGCAEVLPLQTHDLRASNGGDALEFGVSQLDRAFWQLGMAVRNANGRNQGFKYGFKQWLAFSQVPQNSQVVPFRNLIRRLRKWKMNLQNGTLVPRGTFAGYKNFRKLNSGLANLSFEDFASWPPFS